MTMRKTAVAASLVLLTGALGCADLQVDNLNAPDRGRALRNPKDVESLIAGTYRNYWNGQSSQSGPMPFLSTASFQHSAWPANFGLVDYSKFPRIPVDNRTSAGALYDNFSYPWFQNYKAISSVAAGFVSMAEPGFTLGKETDGGDLDLRAKAYGRFVQGTAHGSLAILFDQAVIFDETNDPGESQSYKPYGEVMAAALNYLDQAIDQSSKGAFTLPVDWMSVALTNTQLNQLAHSMKARLRASVARTPDERKKVNWDEVIKDVDAGIKADWKMNVDKSKWSASAMSGAVVRRQWGQLSYFILGMADTSGLYQRWITLPLEQRDVKFADGTKFLIQTPDKRFPKGATEEAQTANKGTMFELPGGPGYPATGYPGSQWGQPGRGTWRWSYYRDKSWDAWVDNGGMVSVVTKAEMDLLKAEGYYYKGQMDKVAELVNPYRTAAGLSATDAAGTNTSCVPRMADGSCGNLWEMLKWEKRLETSFRGAYLNSWYFDGRGWGDLAEGTFLHFPAPAGELDLFMLPHYTLGGVGQTGGAPKGSYGY